MLVTFEQLEKVKAPKSLLCYIEHVCAALWKPVWLFTFDTTKLQKDKHVSSEIVAWLVNFEKENNDGHKKSAV